MASTEDSLLIKFAQQLAGNEKTLRDKALKKFKKWLATKFNSVPAGQQLEIQLLKLWKGLHYCMWMADKPLIQEELADELAGLLHVIKDPVLSLAFFRAYLHTQGREWNGLDQLRLDKFLMLMRRYWHQSLVLLKNNLWAEDLVSLLVSALREGVLSGSNTSFPDGIRYHFADIFWDELEKVGAESLSADQVMLFIKPVCLLLVETNSETLQKHLVKHIFEPPLTWTVGEDSKAKHCKLDMSALASHLNELPNVVKCSGKARSCIYGLLKKYEQGPQPAADKPSKHERRQRRTDPITAEMVQAAVKRLHKFEEKLQQKECKKRKKPRLNTSESDCGISEDLDAEMLGPAPKKTRSFTGVPSTDSPLLSMKSELKIEKENKNRSLKSKAELDKTPKDPKLRRSSSKSPDRNIHCSPDKPHDKVEIDRSPVLKTKAKGVESRVTAKSALVKRKVSGKNEMDGEALKGCSENNENMVAVVKSVRKMRKKSKSLCEGGEHLHTSEKLFDGPLESDTPLKTPKKKKTVCDGSAVLKLKNGQKQLGLNKKRRKSEADKSPRNSVGDASPQPNDLSQNKEVEIVIPLSKIRPKSTSPVSDPFAKFNKVKKTPPAFVAQASKKSTPKTDTKLKRKMLLASLASSAPEKKRVSFIMDRNTAQDFEDSLHPSPVPAFNPKSLPDQGILKASPYSSTIRSPKQQLFKRKKAADFF